MDLNLLIHFEKPLPSMLHRFLGRIVNGRLQISARRQVNDKLACQSAVEGMEQACFAPLGGQVFRFRSNGHGFTIQLETDCVNRAATAVRPLVYCSATTEASASSVPSEFCRRSISANSKGKVEEKSTSRVVPNSITVLSEQEFPSPTTRVKRTGMRTGLASGKNLANLAVELSCRMRALPVACVGTAGYLDVQGRRGLAPQACRLA